MASDRPRAGRLQDSALIPRLLALVGYGVLCGLAGGLLILVVVQAGSFAGWAARTDFGAAYVGARIVLDGQSAQLYDTALQRQMHADLVARYAPVVATLFVYPAWDALVFAPLGWLSYPAAFLVWTLLSLGAGGTALGRLAGAVAPGRRERLTLLLATLGGLPIFLAIAQGQFPLIPLLGLAGAVLASRAGHERAAGAWLLLGLLKPQLIALPVLALLIGRRWRALGVFAAGATALVGTSLLLLGNWLPGYLTLLADYTRPEAGMGDFPAKMQNWRGLVYQLLGTVTGPVAGLLVVALTLLSIVVVGAICRPAPVGIRSQGGTGVPGGPGWEVRFAVAVLLGLLVDPHVYLYDTGIALLPGLVFWGAARGAGTRDGGAGHRRRVLCALLIVGPFVPFLAWVWAVPAVQILPAYLVLLLLAVGWAWPYLASGPLGAREMGGGPGSPVGAPAAGEGSG